MTQQGFDELSAAAPGHVSAVRKVLVDVLSPDELDQLGAMMARILSLSASSASSSASQLKT